MARPHLDEPICAKELAAALKRCDGYVSAMRTAGCPMPGGRTTLRLALDWLLAHPDFNRESVYPTKRSGRLRLRNVSEGQRALALRLP